MKAAHVQARISKRDATRCRPACPGWLVRADTGRKPRLVACVPCNDMHPARLQITDAMVRSLPSANEGLATVKRRITREREERAITRHVGTDTNATSGALCGHSIGRTKSGRRTHVVSFRTGGANCVECLRLAAMTPRARDEERQARSLALATKFKIAREDAANAQEQRRASTEKLVATAREDARVTLDVLESVDYDHEKLAQMALDADGVFDVRALERVALVAETLAMAVTAYRHANRASRGERRWVFRSAEPAGRRRHGVSAVQCRFCGAVLLAEGTFGQDYTATTDGHTVRCALEYLAGKLPETARDGEI